MRVAFHPTVVNAYYMSLRFKFFIINHLVAKKNTGTVMLKNFHILVKDNIVSIIRYRNQQKR